MLSMEVPIKKCLPFVFRTDGIVFRMILSLTPSRGPNESLIAPVPVHCFSITFIRCCCALFCVCFFRLAFFFWGGGGGGGLGGGLFVCLFVFLLFLPKTIPPQFML